MITIAPWESPMIPVIEKAIEKANIGLNPVNDGKLVRLPIPALTEERRKELVKIIKNYAEESRVAIRHVRRDAMDLSKKLEKEGKISEDDSKKAATQIQKLTDNFIAKVDEASQKKEKELMQT
jgi:ribosome recycling factor